MGSADIPQTLLYTQLFKIILSGSLFYLFLSSVTKSWLYALIGSLSYSFMGPIILRAPWLDYATDCVWVSAILYLSEKIFNGVEKKRSILFLILLLVTIACAHWYLYFVYIIPIFLFGLLRFSPLFPNDKNYSSSEHSNYLKIMCFCIISSLALSFPVLLKTLEPVLTSERMLNKTASLSILDTFLSVWNTAPTLDLTTTFFRLFSNELLGSSGKFLGSANHFEAPTPYTSLLILVLFPISAIGHSKKGAKAFSLYLFILTLMTSYYVFPNIRLILNAYSGTYYRFNTFYNAFFIALTCLGTQRYYAIAPNLKRNITIYFFSIISLLSLFSLMIYYHFQIISFSTFKIVCIYLFAYISLIAIDFYFRLKNNKGSKVVQALIVLILCIECVDFSYKTHTKHRAKISKSEYQQNYLGKKSNVEKIVKQLESIDTSIYRIHQLSHVVSYLDPLFLGFWGTTSYYTFNQKSAVDVYRKFNIPTGFNHTILPGSPANDSFNDYVGVKYFLSNKELADREPFLESNDYFIYERTTAMPMIDSIPQNKVSISITKKQENLISGTFNFTENIQLIFRIPYDRHWSFYIDSKKITLTKMNHGFMKTPIIKKISQDHATKKFELKFEYSLL
ncbi:YfhO family protein [Bacteriovoracaceae bacterium]|nr:YfhO family protein [Bacteriovoracaceae bacterium]